MLRRLAIGLLFSAPLPAGAEDGAPFVSYWARSGTVAPSHAWSVAWPIEADAERVALVMGAIAAAIPSPLTTPSVADN